MMRWRKLLKWTLLVLLAVILGFITTLILDWQFWTTGLFFIVYLVIIIILNYYIRKKIYEKRTAFIHKTAAELDKKSLAQPVYHVVKTLHAESKAAVKTFFKKSWILSLEWGDDHQFLDTILEHKLHTSLGNEEDASKQTLCAELPDEVIFYPLENSCDETMNIQWLKLLNYLKSKRHKLPFDQIVITLNFNELVGGDHTALIQKLERLHFFIEKLYDYSGFIIPVSIVLAGAESLNGFDGFTQLFSSEEQQQAIGIHATSLQTKFLSHAWDDFLQQLRDCIDIRLAQANPANKASALFFEHSLMNLNNVMKTVQDILFGGALKLSGIFLIAKENKGTKQVKVFTNDLLKKILPYVLPPATLSSAQQDIARKRARWKFIAFYTCIIAFVIYMTVIFIGTSRDLVKLLRQVPQRIGYSHLVSRNVSTLYSLNAFMNEIIDFKQEWTIKVLPFYRGVNRLEKVYGNRFTDMFNQHVLVLLDKNLSIFLKDNYQTLTPLQRSFLVEHIIARLNILQAKLTGKSMAVINGEADPTIENLGFTGTTSIISKDFSDLYKSYVFLQNNTQVLQAEQAKLTKWLRDFNLITNQQSLQWLMDWMKTQHTVRPISLNNYWNGTTAVAQPLIQYGFTLQGSERIAELVNGINRALPGYMNINHEEQLFWIWYNEQRILAWKDFSKQFMKGTTTLKDRVEWSAIYKPDVALTPKGPFYGLMESMAKQFKNDPAENTVPWLITLKDFYGLMQFHVDNKELSSLTSMTKLARDMLEGLKNVPSEVNKGMRFKAIYRTDINTKLKAARSFVAYQEGLTKLYSNTSITAAESYKMLASIYKGKAIEDLEPAKMSAKNPLSHIYNSYLQMYHVMHRAGDDAFWSIMRGPFDFYLAYNSQNASCYVQKKWMEKVLKPSFGQTGDNLTTLLFGGKGSVWKFISTTLQPFVEIQQHLFVPKIKFGYPLPLTSEFYDFLNAGLTIQTLTHEEERFKKLINAHAKQSIVLVVSPTNVNQGAKLLPYRTSIETTCDAKPLTINNYNFSAVQPIPEKITTCGSTTLSIYFKTFTLVKEFPGKYGFAKFLDTFLNGYEKYTANDFPKQKAMLHAYNVSHIIVKMETQGMGTIADQLHQFVLLRAQLLANEKKYTGVQGNYQVPQKIAMCWVS